MNSERRNQKPKTIGEREREREERIYETVRRGNRFIGLCAPSVLSREPAMALLLQLLLISRQDIGIRMRLRGFPFRPLLGRWRLLRMMVVVVSREGKALEELDRRCAKTPLLLGRSCRCSGYLVYASTPFGISILDDDILHLEVFGCGW